MFKDVVFIKKALVKPKTERQKKPICSYFMIVFLLLFVLMAAAFAFFLNLDIARLLIFSTEQNPLMWVIYTLIGIGIIIALVAFWQTLKEQAVIAALIAYRNEIDKEKGRLPLAEFRQRSVLVDHFQRFYTAKKSQLSERSKINLEKYLAEIFLGVTFKLEFIQEILLLLGLLGTAYGLAGACLNKADASSMFGNIAIAIGTTVVAICGKLIISTLNHLLLSERRLQLKSFLVILGLEAKE